MSAIRFESIKGKLGVLVSGLCLASAFLFLFGRSLDNLVYDYFFLIRGLGPKVEEVVVIAIDEPSFEEVNLQWPWPRSIHAKLLESLKKTGVKTVGFDLLFAEPSEEDEAFAKALMDFPHAVLVSDIGVINDPKYGIAGESIVEPNSIIDLMETPLKTGFANMDVESDGFLRALDVSREEISPLSFVLAEDYLRQKGVKLEPVNTSSAKRYIDFIGPPKSITTISYYQALEPEKFLPEGFLKDKLVLVGFATASQATSGMSVIDHYLGPYSRGGGGYYPGVEIHAHAVAGFLSGREITRSNVETVRLYGLILGTVLGLFVLSMPLVSGTSLAVFFLISVMYYEFYQFERYSIYSSVLYLCLPGVSILFLNPFLKYLISLKQRRFLREAFSTYLAPEVVKQIIAKPDSLALGGMELESTIFFLDVVGYTAISEKVTANELISFVNRTLGRLSEIILKHEGMIDKFIGDCIMAGWGLPLPTSDHAKKACEATLDILKVLPEIIREENENSGANLSVRIGLSTGIIVAGNVGGGKRFNYTALGNDVNLAARLESLNKFYGTKVMVSERTKLQAGDDFLFRKLDKIRVKGQKQPVDIYELQLDGEMPKIKKYEEALDCYFKMEFARANVMFKELADQGDSAGAVLSARCEEYLIKPPTGDWDGVHTMLEK